MNMIQDELISSREVIYFIGTTAATENSFAEPYRQKEEWSRNWKSIIDNTLIDWGRSPNQIDEDGYESPSPDAVQKACEFARIYGVNNSLQNPLRTIQNGNAGIVFEWSLGPDFISLEFNEKGIGEFVHFRNALFVERIRL